MDKIKVILSTFGPLHLVKGAEHLSKVANVRVIQGWIPRWWNQWLLYIVSKIVGYDVIKTMRKRKPLCLRKHNVGILMPDFYNNIVCHFVKNKELKDKLKTQALSMYGRMSCRYIGNAQIFHVRSGSGRGGAIQCAKKQGMKVVVDHSIAHPNFMETHLREEYEKNGRYFPIGTNSFFWKSVEQDCIDADIIEVNSHFVRDTFIEAGFDPNKIRVVYLGVRDDFLGLKREYVIHKKLHILFTGNFGFRKGAEYILRALQGLDKIGVDYEFIIVGNYKESIELIEKYPIKNIHLEGIKPQDDLKYYLSKSDIYLFPSLCEGCASSGMEALAAGIPVIATIESGLPIEDQKTGIIVPSKNVDAIVGSILLLSKDEKLRQRIGMQSVELIKNKYTWDNYAWNVLDIYKELEIQ